MRNWIENLILTFRKEYENLSKLEKSKVSNLDNLTPPLQVEIFCIKNKQLKIEHQLFIFTHFVDNGDLDIIIHEIESHEAIEKLQVILKNEKWQRKLPEGERYLIKNKEKNKLATIIEGFFIGLLRDFKGRVLNSVLSKPKDFSPRILGKIYLTKDSFVWKAFGNVCHLEAKEITGKIIEETKKNARVKPQTPSPQPPKPRIKGFGTYFYPPIWIGEMPKASFEENVLETNSPLMPKKAFDTEYKGYKVVVNENGLIAIGVEGKNQALEMVNEIMTTALLQGFPFYAIRESEFEEAEIEQEKLTICSHGISHLSIRTALFYEEWESKIKFSYLFRSKKELSKEKLIEIIKQTESLTEHKEIKDILPFLLEAYTYFETSECNQSFMMSWIILEKYLSFLWEEFMKEKDISGKRKQKLDSFTIDQIIETMNLAGKIGKEYEMLMDMKNKRNKFIHEGKSISQEDAQKGFKTAYSLVINFCKALGCYNDSMVEATRQIAK